MQRPKFLYHLFVGIYLYSIVNFSHAASTHHTDSLNHTTSSKLTFNSSLSYLNPTLTYSIADPGFSFGEHIVLGNEIKLNFSSTTPRAHELLHMPNGAVLSYGDILSYGDFYGVVGKAISRGITDTDKRLRFQAAFDMFTSDKAVLPELDAIRDISRQELTILATRMRGGESPEAIYKSISTDMQRQMNCVTGGGCHPTTWWLNRGRYLKLAQDNFDHFGDDAITTYRIGHTLALEQAITAHATHRRDQLELAYALNGFASHFLSDRFAAGHIRTPRVELTEHVTPDLAAQLLASYMHSEENAYGLHVHDQLGDRWIAFGDWYYFSNVNTASRYIQFNALQTSADEIFTAYQTGEMPTFDKALTYVPIPDETGSAANDDISPMFYWDQAQQTLFRRQMLSNPYDRHWTDNWWGWSTLAELREEQVNKNT